MARETRPSDEFQDLATTQNQTEIIERGKKIEEFIQKAVANMPDDTSVKLLVVMFQLFKSEVEAGLALRKSLNCVVGAVKEVEQGEAGVKRLLECVQKYNPDASTLSDVIAVYKSMKGAAAKGGQHLDLEQAQSDLARLVRKFEFKEKERASNEEELELVTSQWKERIETQTREYNAARDAEAALEERLHSVQSDNAGLREKLGIAKVEEDPSVLKRTITVIDTKMDELQKKIELLTRKHHQRSRACKSTIQRLKLENEVMEREREDVQQALDAIHAKIDMYVNPLTAGDNIMTPHGLRVRLGALGGEIDERKKQFASVSETCKQLEQGIEGMKATVESVGRELERDQLELQQLVKQVGEREIVVAELEQQRLSMSESVRTLRQVDREKRSLESKLIQLRQELESAKSTTRHLVIDNHSLKESVDVERVRAELSRTKEGIKPILVPECVLMSSNSQ